MNQTKGIILSSFLGLAILNGCQGNVVRTPVMVSQTEVYERPDAKSPKIATLVYGQEVLAYPKSPSRIKNEWTKVRLEKIGKGYVKDTSLGTPETVEKMHALQKSIEGIGVQATGVTIAPTFLRLAPSREGTPVEKLPTGTTFEMFERQASYRSKPTDSRFSPKSTDKDIWYKVRLKDGRVGYIFTSNFKLTPPPELSFYTNNRRAAAWQILRTKTGSEGETVHDYVVAYSTPGTDFGADFNRIEIYYWGDGQYQTAFVKSNLHGILPLRVFEEGEKVYYEFSELNPDQANEVTVSRFPFAYPYKAISQTPLAKDVGLH